MPEETKQLTDEELDDQIQDATEADGGDEESSTPSGIPPLPAGYASDTVAQEGEEVTDDDEGDDGTEAEDLTVEQEGDSSVIRRMRSQIRAQQRQLKEYDGAPADSGQEAIIAKLEALEARLGEQQKTEDGFEELTDDEYEQLHYDDPKAARRYLEQQFERKANEIAEERFQHHQMSQLQQQAAAHNTRVEQEFLKRTGLRVDSPEHLEVIGYVQNYMRPGPDGKFPENVLDVAYGALNPEKAKAQTVRRTVEGIRNAQPREATMTPSGKTGGNLTTIGPNASQEDVRIAAKSLSNEELDKALDAMG